MRMMTHFLLGLDWIVCSAKLQYLSWQELVNLSHKLHYYVQLGYFHMEAKSLAQCPPPTQVFRRLDILWASCVSAVYNPGVVGGEEGNQPCWHIINWNCSLVYSSPVLVRVCNLWNLWGAKGQTCHTQCMRQYIWKYRKYSWRKCAFSANTDLCDMQVA